MKARDIKVGEIFVADNTIRRPKIKLRESFVDMVTQYVYVNKENLEARVLTESELIHVRRNWRMIPKEFEDYKQLLIKKYVEEEK